MNNQQKKNQRTILIIFALSIVPFLIAWFLRENPELMTARTNNGELIVPPIMTERTDLTGYDGFSKTNLKELNGHWVLINVIPNQDCNEVCRQALYKTRQLLLMMGKDLVRIRRSAWLFKDVAANEAEIWWQDDPRLLRVKPSAALLTRLASVLPAPISDGMLLLMDPLGNVLMYYLPGFDPYQVKSDIKRLLNISQIG